MDYEVLYKDALERAEEIIKYYKEHNRGDEASIEDLETIFPELAESEDERVRKELIEYFNVYPKGYFGELKKSHILAWLGKQEGKHITESQSRWRPSEEQMQMLHRAVVAIAPGVVHDGLESLYNDLKNI